ncbi:FG-GAP repeat domain-containing protein [Microbacterium sp. GXF6406]
MPRIARLLTVLVAATALVVGTVAPVSVATASASSSTSASSPRALADLTKTGVVKTSLVGFTPGNIISDAVFTNKSTMTEAQIQTFLNSKVSRCQSGYVCLKDLKAPTQKKSADAYCSGYAASSGETAARIIYKVAQSCNMNPQVLITMLQKEQGLVTHTWPSDWRYNAAMGQACPDTAPCDVAYAGFFAQVYGAARQMQIYLEGKWFQWYKAGQTWQIQYHPDRVRCGTGAVYIANKATEAMYYYTPYQPNASALAAGYGEGNSCASYGNRNFYNYFTDWFGSTQATKAPGPALGSVDSASFVIGLDTAGVVWAYPFAKGVWGEQVKIASGLTGYRQVFSVGNLLGKGHRDLIGIAADGRAWLIPGTGGITFGAPRLLTSAWQNAVEITPAGDFDGDGLPDVFTTNAAGELLLWRGLESGTFAPGKVIGSGWNVTDRLIGGYDMTRDGKIDLVARWADGSLVVYRGDGKGGWLSGTVKAGHGWQVMDKIFVPGDFSGDGIPDILASNAAGTLTSYIGQGDGRVSTGSTVGSGWHQMSSASGAGAVAGAARVPTAGVGDIDNDGARDVLAVFGNELRNYRGTGTGRFAGTVKISSSWSPTDQLLSLGDFNGDGVRDIGRITDSGDFYLLLGNGAGGFGEQKQIGHGWDVVDIFLTGFDFNGDGFNDVIARNGVGELILYAGDNAGGWLASRPVIGWGWDIVTDAFYTGDFDRNGTPDILARMKNGTLRLYSMSGNGSWAGSRDVGWGWQDFTAVTSPGDFNGDGHVDVLARTSTGALKLYRGDGTGAWLGALEVGSGWNSVSQLR